MMNDQTALRTNRPQLLALDWGTSSLRAYLLAGSDTILETRCSDHGIMNLPQGSFEEALANLCGDWLTSYPEMAVVAAGMVGSAQGWTEAPYVSTPADISDLAGRFCFVEMPDGRSIAIVPGVMHDALMPDLMRGEETQVIGALALHDRCGRDDEPTLIVLPGTHSKWVQVRGRRIQHFKTFMTGELYAVLSRHSILGRLMQASEGKDDDAFERGITTARREEASGLAALLFSVRSLGLTERLRPDQIGDYLSGLLIGYEIKEASAICMQEKQNKAAPVLIGEQALCDRYRCAMDAFGWTGTQTLSPAATSAGIWMVAAEAGMLPGLGKELKC